MGCGIFARAGVERHGAALEAEEFLKDQVPAATRHRAGPDSRRSGSGPAIQDPPPVCIRSSSTPSLRFIAKCSAYVLAYSASSAT